MVILFAFDKLLMSLRIAYQRRHPHSVGGFTSLENEATHKQIVHENIHATPVWEIGARLLVNASVKSIGRVKIVNCSRPFCECDFLVWEIIRSSIRFSPIPAEQDSENFTDGL